MFWQTRQGKPYLRSTVQEDWIAWLPEKKRFLYETTVRRWEDAYAMLSVALNEALSFRDQGELTRARESAMISAELISFLAEPLENACRALETNGRHIAVPPAVSPLNPEYFRTLTARHTAERNHLLHTILFAARSRCVHKLRALEFTVSNLASEFRTTAEDLACGTQAQPERCWLALDSLHYDLNTCLRETVVLFKSFLRAMPEAGLESLQRELNAASIPKPAQLPTRRTRVSS